MNIVFASRTTVFHGAGGMESISWDVASGLRNAGHRVWILTTTVPGRPSIFSQDGIEIRTLSGTRPGRYSWRWWSGSAAAAAQAPLADADVIVSVGNGALAIARRVGRIKAWRGAIVLQAHGTAVGEFLSKLRSRKLKNMVLAPYNLLMAVREIATYHHFDRLIAVGEAVRGELLRYETVSRHSLKDKTVLILNGVDTRLFRPPVAEEKRPDDLRPIVFIGRLHPQKGCLQALHGYAAYLRLCPEGAQPLLMVGAGPEETRLRNEIQKLGLTQQVRLLGQQSRTQVAELLRRASALLFPTLRVEGLPMNVLEALASGVRVIISRSQKDRLGLPLGLYGVDPLDPDEIARTLQQLAGDTDYQPGSLLPEDFTIDHAVAAYDRLFRTLAQTGHVDGALR
jgi:glycosyltransferase involved in cell wall biosynthesis